MKRVITSIVALTFFMSLTTVSFAQYGTTKTADTTVKTAKPTRPRGSIKITAPKVSGRSIYKKRREARAAAAAQAQAAAQPTMTKDMTK